LWTTVGCFASFMMTRYSYPLGRMLPGIEIAQFPWRMLCITTLVAALALGVCADVFARRKRGSTIAILGVAGVIILGLEVCCVVRVISAGRPQRVEKLDIDKYDELVPRSLQEDPENLPVSRPAYLVHGHGQVVIKKWDPQHRELWADIQEHDQMRIGTFNFPG